MREVTYLRQVLSRHSRVRGCLHRTKRMQASPANQTGSTISTNGRLQYHTCAHGTLTASALTHAATISAVSTAKRFFARRSSFSPAVKAKYSP